MKTTMDKNTILFVAKGNKKSIAFDYKYYKKNYNNFLDRIEDPEKILFKMGDKTDTWINYKKSIQLLTGSLQERLEKALVDEDGGFRITDVREIPSVDYYDVEGYCYQITPYDGIYNTTYWTERAEYNLDALKFSFVNEEDLRVEFMTGEDITDAFITLNNFFHKYEVINKTTVIFRKIKSSLTRVLETGDESGQYDIRIHAYSWQGLKKQTPIFPRTRENEWFVMPKEMEYDSIIIYKGLTYEYEIHFHDKKKIKLTEASADMLADFNLNELAVYQMKSGAPNKETRKYTVRGIANKYRGTVEFTLPVKDSMVVYNGMDNEYEVTTDTSIYYPDSMFSVSDVTVNSRILSVNFTKGW